MRFSLEDDITDRQLENGALYCGRYTLDVRPRDDRRSPKADLSIWTQPERNRHLAAGVFVGLNEACRELTGFGKYYVPLVIFLAVETGLRLEELCALKWEDVSLGKRRMEIAKPGWPEEHEARTVVLSVRARQYLHEVCLALQKDDRFDTLDPVIPMKLSVVRRALEDVARRSELVLNQPLFDGLHREAEAKFREAGLTNVEREIMLGSALRILPGSQEDLLSIQDKLDRHLLDGQTYEEAKDNIPIIPADKIISLREMMADWGLLEIPKASQTVIRHFPNVVLRILAA